MNKRDKFLFKNLLIFGSIISFFLIVALFNVKQFNSSYMKEEQNELNIFHKQIEWAIIPYLKTKDYKTVQKYCSDFSESDLKVILTDSNNNIIAASGTNVPTTKIITDTRKISAGNNDYYVKLVISEKDVTDTITHAQLNLLIFMFLLIVFMVSGIIYITRELRIPFNKLQNSVIKISNGELETQIDIPQIGILEELALALKKMTERLKKQITRLRQLEKYKSDFIQNISHEIKTPITAINSAIELIESNDKLENNNDVECFRIIKYQLKFINRLVNDILSLSEIEVEKDSENKTFKFFNLNTTIKNLIDNTINDIIPINFKEEYSDINILGEEELISRAVLNLLTNAIRYSQSDNIDVILTKTDNFAEIHVKDYGIGLPEEYKEVVFERFFRVDKTRSRKTGGTGLGLAIVKNIAELHKGYAYVNSVQGEGADFVIKIPIN